MIRVLQLPDSIEKRNGRMSVIMNVYRKLDRNKIQFDFLATDYGFLNYADEIKRLGGKVLFLPVKELSLKNIKKTFNDVMSKSKYDYVHYHALSKWGCCISLAHRYDTKVIVHSHATQLSDTFIKSVRNRIFSLNILTSSDKRVAVSPEAGKKLFMWQSFEYIPNMIDYENFRFNEGNRERIRRKYNIKNDETLIGMVGRISKQKNQIFALKVLKKLIKGTCKFKLMIVGDADNHEQKVLVKLKKYINQNNLSAHVIFTGMVNNVQDYYSASDIFWLPSFYEGMPTAGIEAQANGLKLFVSKNVSKSLNITNNIAFIGLNIPEWVENITNNPIKRDKDSYHKIENSIFNTEKIIMKWNIVYGIEE